MRGKAADSCGIVALSSFPEDPNTALLSMMGGITSLPHHSPLYPEHLSPSLLGSSEFAMVAIMEPLILRRR